MRPLLALAVVAAALVLAAPVAGAAGDDEARFRAATVQLGGGDVAGAADAFERLANDAPSSPWADDALMEAAGAAERLGQLDRARRQLERLVATYPDSRLARRAASKLAQLVAATGARGEWSAVAAEHDAILRDAAGPGDPRPQLRRLEALVRAHPGYPRAHDARMWIGDTWLRQGESATALTWYREAIANAPDARARVRARKAEADALAMRGELDAAEAAYRALGAEPGADRDVIDGALDDVAGLRVRARIMVAAWIALAVLALAAALALWRATRGVRPALRALARPPTEVLFAAPVAAVLIAVSLAGNQLVAAAVRSIALGGLAVGWLSGACLEAARRRGPIGWRRVLFHVVAAAIAVAAIGYLSVMRDRLIDMIVETWKHGPEG